MGLKNPRTGDPRDIRDVESDPEGVLIPDAGAGMRAFDGHTAASCAARFRAPPEPVVRERHSHYYKDVQHLEHVDVYRVLSLFNVTDPCLQHALKKLLVAGGRGAGKDVSRDIQEAIDSLLRWQEMQHENNTIR